MLSSYLQLFPFSVSTGGDFSIFLKQGGGCRVCGKFIDIKNLTSPSIKFISGGGFHALILNYENEAFAYGMNSFGQLGKKYERNSGVETIPLLFSLKIQFVSAGTTHSLFLDSEGNVWSCGSNGTGELGTGNTKLYCTPQKNEFLPRCSFLSAGNGRSLFLEENGSVWCCGNNSNGELGVGHNNNVLKPEKIENLPSIDIVSAGFGSHCLFLDTVGCVWASGDGKFGAIGTSDRTSRYRPEKIQELPKVQFISAGFHSLFLDLNQRVWVCGYNNCGQLGLGDTTTRSSPEELDMPPITFIAAGGYHSLFVDMEGYGWGCGCNDFAQLGIDPKISEQELRPIRIPNMSGLKATYMHKEVNTKNARKL